MVHEAWLSVARVVQLRVADGAHSVHSLTVHVDAAILANLVAWVVLRGPLTPWSGLSADRRARTLVLHRQP